jgi:hypothetical protein
MRLDRWENHGKSLSKNWRTFKVSSILLLSSMTISKICIEVFSPNERCPRTRTCRSSGRYKRMTAFGIGFLFVLSQTHLEISKWVSLSLELMHEKVRVIWKTVVITEIFTAYMKLLPKYSHTLRFANLSLNVKDWLMTFLATPSCQLSQTAKILTIPSISL